MNLVIIFFLVGRVRNYGGKRIFLACSYAPCTYILFEKTDFR